MEYRYSDEKLAGLIRNLQGWSADEKAESFFKDTLGMAEDLRDARAELEAINRGQGFPGLPNPAWPHGVILRYNAGGCRMGKYNAKYYRVDRLAAGITPENEADKARDLLLAILKDLGRDGSYSDTFVISTSTREAVRDFLGPKALKAAGIK